MRCNDCGNTDIFLSVLMIPVDVSVRVENGHTHITEEYGPASNVCVCGRCLGISVSDDKPKVGDKTTKTPESGWQELYSVNGWSVWRFHEASSGAWKFAVSYGQTVVKEFLEQETAELQDYVSDMISAMSR